MKTTTLIPAAATIAATAYTQLEHTNPHDAAIPLTLLLTAALIKALTRLLRNRPTRRTRFSILIKGEVLEQTTDVLIWGAFFSAIAILFPGLFQYRIAGKITAQKLIIATLAFAASYITSRAATNYIASVNRHDKAILIKTRILHYTAVITALTLTLKYLGLGTAITNLLLAGSITSIILGLAAQKTIGNFIAGIILLLDKPFKIGDYIEIQGVRGFVTDIQFMSTTIRTYDEKTIRIPNEAIITERVTNYRKNKIIRITNTIGISYDSSIDAARRAILEALEEEELVLMYPEPQIGVEKYADSAIIIKFWYYVPFDDWYTVSMRVLENIKKKLDKHGVKIPYPQLVIHGGDPMNVFIYKQE